MGASFTLYRADVRGDKSNTLYAHPVEVHDVETLRRAVMFDHVGAKFHDGYRSGANFVTTDCLVMDLDNQPNRKGDPDIPPDSWILPQDIAVAFPGVEFWAVASRNHMKQKGPYSPRPRYHIYFPLSEAVTDAENYARMKQRIQAHFPVFDTSALDAARFFFGVADPQIDHFEGVDL